MLRATASKIAQAIKEFDYKENAVKAYNKTIEYSKNLYIKALDKAENLTEKSLFNISAVITAFMFLTVLPAAGLDFGYKLVCDGEAASVVSSKTEATEILAHAQKELKEIPSAKKPSKIDIVITIANKEMIQQGECAVSSVVACYDGREDCYGIFADGKLAAAVSNETDAYALLNDYKNEYKTDNAVSVGFNKNVEVKPARTEKGNILSKEDALLALKAPEIKRITYTVRPGDTLSEIAQSNGLSLSRIIELNPGISAENIKDGNIINLTDTSPLIAVREARKVTETETVQFATDKIDDSSSYVGTTIVVANGVLGEKEVEYEVVYENGIEVVKTPLKETVTKEPISATVKVGTKPRPKTAPTGSFKMPYYGVLTSRYGVQRSRSVHRGIDLAGPVGGNVVASDGGTVTFAGWDNGGYGYMVKIRHSNGYETYYAHLSAVKVSKGQQVYQGQTIGLVGNTGRSTGPHLHFEVRKNGTPVNPYSYIR